MIVHAYQIVHFFLFSAKLEPECIDVVAYNTVNFMCYLYACGDDPNNVEVSSTDQHRNWVLYSTFGKVPQDPYP